MAFWSNKDASPARKYRFKVGTTQNINWWYANSVTLPSFEINTNEYQLLNQKFKYPGVPTWNDVTISIVDVASAVEEVKKVLVSKDFNFLQEEGILKIESVTKKKTTPAAAGVAATTTAAAKVSNFVIEQMKDDGTTLRTWTLVNSFIKSVNYGDLDYSSDDLVSIEITVAYDYATTEK
tara:strand:+ start:358 stop:894 length:537 start_codon:yes stop_codon:yes gene_type:complete